MSIKGENEDHKILMGFRESWLEIPEVPVDKKIRVEELSLYMHKGLQYAGP